MDTSPSKAATAPTDFPQLQALSTEQLQELLMSREAFQKLADSLVKESQPMHVRTEMTYTLLMLQGPKLNQIIGPICASKA